MLTGNPKQWRNEQRKQQRAATATAATAETHARIKGLEVCAASTPVARTQTTILHHFGLMFIDSLLSFFSWLPESPRKGGGLTGVLLFKFHLCHPTTPEKASGTGGSLGESNDTDTLQGESNDTNKLQGSVLPWVCRGPNDQRISVEIVVHSSNTTVL